MRPDHLDALRPAAPPDEAGARERAWRRVETGLNGGAPPPALGTGARPGGRLPRGPLRGLRAVPLGGRLAAAAFAALIVLGVAVTPPGDAVANWVRTAVGLRPQVHLPTDRAPRSVRPPSGGRLLVSSSGSLFIVGADGARRRLGPWTNGAWSPRGRFVVAWQGRRLAALDARGRVHWSLTAPARVTDALWSPSGFRIAYRIVGGGLRVVAGDG